MRRFVGDRTRTESSLRLWLFVGLCGVLSTLLLVALVVDDTHSLARNNLVPESPVFLPRWPLDILSWRAPAAEIEDTKGDTNRPTMRLVETLPVGDFQLNSTLKATHDVLIRHTQQAKRSIDISAMYWNLLGADDRKVYSPDDMKRFGADRGTQLFQALVDAAQRGVTLRIVTAGDSIGGGGRETQLPDELEKLKQAAPDHVLIRTWSGSPWYGGGILHQKLWIFDQHHVYVGSANMDWKSLAQVMEMGVVLEDLKPETHVLQDLQRLFDVWWLWTQLDPKQVTTYFSDRFQAELKVPAWSRHVPHASRLPDPFADAGFQAHGNVLHQLKTVMADGSMANLFVASSPAESTASASRTFDEDALVYTIETAEKSVSLSVMDFSPYSMYGLETHQNASIWWPALSDAILAGVFGKRGLHVRLLISQWQSTKRAMLQALKALEQQAALCQLMRCGGSLEIKIFRVPGWQNTTRSPDKTPPMWPAFTRVNHAKYIVSDRRVNVGTSNMEWGYFYTTAGISMNTDHNATRQAMEDVFNRNWVSDYAIPLRNATHSLKD